MAAASLLLLVAVAYGAEGYSWRVTDSEAGAPINPVSPGYGTTRPLEEELLVSVSIWGEVDKPGIYDVPDGTNVAELISYAGGPTEFANLSRVKLTRPEEGNAARVDIKSYLARGDVNALPQLRPGDTVYVHRNAKYAWTAVIEVVSQLAVVAGTVLLYIEVANKE